MIKKGVSLLMALALCLTLLPASALAAEGDPKRLRVQRLLHYGLPMLVCLALAVVWVCTRNMPLWPDKAAMLLALGALGIGYGFRGWYLYYNDRDQ